MFMPLVATAHGDEASEEEAFSAEADVGLFFARLGGGLTALTSSLDDDRVNRAVRSVGTGTGNVTRLQGRVEVAGYDLFFSYVSDEIFDAGGQQVVEDQSGNRLAEEALLLIAGELRPDIRDLLVEGDRLYVKVEFGRLEGVIEEPYRFATRNTRPWFPSSAGASWDTDLLTLEAGVIGEDIETDRRGRSRGTTAGAFTRLTRFGRPAVLGFGEDDGGGFALQDTTLTVVGAGFRFGLESCDLTCWSMAIDLIPFTGLAFLDLGDFGSQSGGVLAGGTEISWSLPIRFGKAFSIAPYASFRADWLMPFTGNIFETGLDKAQLWLPDYLLWGPMVGLTVEI